jgi:Ala-tRNA(Pro) deacylase
VRVPLFLADHRVAFETLYHPPAYTAQRRAHYLHVPGSRLVKAVLLRAPAGRLLAVLPADARVDLGALAATLGGPVRLASADEVREVFRDCEWGGLTPFGSLYGLATVLDAALDPEALIVFEAHNHAEAIRMRCRDFERLERPRRLRFARRERTAPPHPGRRSD